MSEGELCFLTLAEQARLIRDGEVSPVQVVESALAQIDRIDGRLNAFVTMMREEALAAAREAEQEIVRGNYRGPLHGIPIALKDLFHTKGVRTTAGSKILADFVPAEDATVVSRLKEAGAVMIGKTGMNEFAYGATGTNSHYGDVRNPWDLDRITGGSSSGSAAAVASRMVPAALGSDTGGSIRIPSALCGVAGIKPTYGRVSRHGVVPCAWSFDHVGPIARTAEDCALVLAVLAGPDPKDPTSSPEPVPDYAADLSRGVSGLRVAVLQEYATDPMEPEVAAGFERALEVLRQLGAAVEEVSVPLVDYTAGAMSAISAGEISSYHDRWLRTRPEDYGAELRTRIEANLLVAASDYVNGQRVRARMIEEFHGVFRRYDALVCPTEPITAPRLGQETVVFGDLVEPMFPTLVRHTRLFNFAALPAVSVPCGFASNGLPIALEIAAAPFAETVALRLAHAYERATGWHVRVPEVARS